MHLSVRPANKAEAVRWIRYGIELAVIDPITDLPITQKEGRVQIVERGWVGVVTLKDGLVRRIE